MNTNEVKQTVYCFLKNKISEKFPDKFPLAENGATNKIFWANIKSDSPQRPIIILSTVYKSRLHKRFNPYYKNNIRYEPEQWRLTVKFEVKTAASDGNLYEAEKLGNTIIDFIEKLFSNTQATFDYFGAYGIVIDELEISQIRDLSKFAYTNNEYIFSIDVPFDYEDVEETTYEKGEIVGVDIKVDNSDNSIRMEV